MSTEPRTTKEAFEEWDARNVESFFDGARGPFYAGWHRGYEAGQAAVRTRDCVIALPHSHHRRAEASAAAPAPLLDVELLRQVNECLRIVIEQTRANGFHDWPAILERARALLAATTAPPAPPPLDAGRLARALHIVDDEVQFMHRDASQHRDVIARRIAAEYTLLAAAPAQPAEEPR